MFKIMKKNRNILSLQEVYLCKSREPLKALRRLGAEVEVRVSPYQAREKNIADMIYTKKQSNTFHAMPRFVTPAAPGWARRRRRSAAPCERRG